MWQGVGISGLATIITSVTSMQVHHCRHWSHTHLKHPLGSSRRIIHCSSEAGRPISTSASYAYESGWSSTNPGRIPWVARPYLHWNLVCVAAIASCLNLDDSWLWRLMMEHLDVGFIRVWSWMILGWPLANPMGSQTIFALESCLRWSHSYASETGWLLAVPLG